MNRPKTLLLGVAAVTAVAGCATRAPSQDALAQPPTADTSLTLPATTAAAAEPPAVVAVPIPTTAEPPAPAPRRAWRAGNGKAPPGDGTACPACADD